MYFYSNEGAEIWDKIMEAGKEYGILAIFSGIVLTILVPFIISLILA